MFIYLVYWKCLITPKIFKIIDKLINYVENIAEQTSIK